MTAPRGRRPRCAPRRAPRMPPATAAAAGLDAVPVDDALEHRAAPDDAAVADDQRADELGLGLDEAAGADEHRRLDGHVVGDRRVVADPDPGRISRPGHLDVDPAHEGVEVAAGTADVADVVPVRPSRQQWNGTSPRAAPGRRPWPSRRTCPAGCSRRSPARTRRCRSCRGPRAPPRRRLLLEPDDPAGFVVHDDAVQGWVVDRLHGECGDAPGRRCVVTSPEVDVGQGIAADHDERAVAEELAEAPRRRRCP